MSSPMLVVLATLAPAVAEEPQEAPPEAPPETASEDTPGPEIRVSLTEDVEVRYYVGEAVPDPYFEQVSRTNLITSGGSWTIGAQVDEVLVAGTTYIDPLGIQTQAVDLLAPETRFPLDNAYLNLEKLYATGRRDGWDATVGDFYASFGRGIALDVARRPEIDVDTSLQGARVGLEGERAAVLFLSGFANPQQVLQDNRNSEIDLGLAHVVHGARADLWGVGPFDMGLHGVAITLAPINTFGIDWSRYAETPETIILGTTMGARAFGDNLEFFGEFDARLPGSSAGRDDEAVLAGWAGYTSVTAYTGPLVFLLEGKRYLDMEEINYLPVTEGYELMTPPTLEYERVITEDSSATVNSSDVFGARLRVDWAIRPGKTMTYLSVAAFRDESLNDRLHFNATPETVIHPVLGVQQTGLGSLEGIHLFANGGLRVDQRDPGPDGTDYGQDVQFHADLAIGPWPARRGLEWAIAVERFLWGNNPIQQTDYTEIESALSWHAAPPLILIAYLDFSTNPLVKGGAYGTPGNLSENIYGAFEAQVKPNSHTTIKAFYGAYKSGIRCSGGQCKQLPAFEGVRASLVFTL